MVNVLAPSHKCSEGSGYTYNCGRKAEAPMSGLTGATSGGLFSGSKSKRMKTNTKEMNTVKSSRNTGRPYVMEGLSMLETCDDDKVQQKEQGSDEGDQVKESHPGDVSMDVQTSPLPCGQGGSDRPPSPSAAIPWHKQPPSTPNPSLTKRTLHPYILPLCL